MRNTSGARTDLRMEYNRKQNQTRTVLELFENESRLLLKQTIVLGLSI